MQVFTDKNDFNWEISLSVGLIEEIKSKMEIDLLEPVKEDHSLIVDLTPVNPANITRFCDLLFLICEEQCKEKELDVTVFKRLLDVKTMKAAYDAFFAEWQAFFQSLERPDIAEAMVKIREMLKIGVAEVIKEMEKIEFPTGSLSGSSPESSE